MSQPNQQSGRRQPRFHNWLIFAGVAWAAVALSGVVLFAISRPNIAFNIALSILILLAAAAVGSLAGFLFGVPKSLPAMAPEGWKLKLPYIANSNFEKISDWVTTVIVGLGLVEFRELLAGLKRLGIAMGVAFGDTPGGPNSGAIYSLTMLIAGTLISFLITYMWAKTRLYEVLLQQESTGLPTA